MYSACTADAAVIIPCCSSCWPGDTAKLELIFLLVTSFKRSPVYPSRQCTFCPGWNILILMIKFPAQIILDVCVYARYCGRYV